MVDCSRNTVRLVPGTERVLTVDNSSSWVSGISSIGWVSSSDVWASDNGSSWISQELSAGTGDHDGSEEKDGELFNRKNSIEYLARFYDIECFEGSCTHQLNHVEDFWGS